MNETARSLLTIEKWHDRTAGGEFIPLHIPIHGSSMFPEVRYMRDYVTIVPLKEMPVVGDIVMFHDPLGKRYVLHRVIRIEGSTVTTRGDNCLGPDRPMPLDDVWGKAVLIERGKRQIRPDPVKGMRHAKCWYTAGRVYRFANRAMHAVYRRIRGIFKFNI